MHWLRPERECLSKKAPQDCIHATKKHSYLFLPQLVVEICAVGIECFPWSCEARLMAHRQHRGPAPLFESCEPLAKKDVRATSTRRIYDDCSLFPLSFPLEPRISRLNQEKISRRPLKVLVTTDQTLCWRLRLWRGIITVRNVREGHGRLI